MIRRLVPFLFVLALVPGAARASGLVADPATAEARPALVPLQALVVTATMSEVSATIAETRTYAPLGAAAYTEGRPVRFYRTLAGGESVTSLSVNGAAVLGLALDAAAADALRRELVAGLHDPGPLRDFGAPLFVSDPIAAQELWTPIVVELAVTMPLLPHGTMRGVSVPVDWHKKPVDMVKVDVSATTEAALRALYAPYHTLSLTRDGERSLHGTYQGYQRCTAFDVTLLLSTGDEPFHLDLLPHRDGKDADGTWMALLSTPPAGASESVLARDVVVVVDRSGSMQGEKIAQARSALAGVLEGLQPEDSFTVISFSSGVEAFSATAVPADAAHVAAAKGFVSELVADGGTNIYDALAAGFAALPVTTGHPRYIVFLTDGQATAGNTDTEAILAMVNAKNEVGARIFAFGIGDDVNTVLLDRLANDSGGDALYIRPGHSVDAAVTAFFGSITDPVLTDPALDATAFGAAHVYPAALPDLFAAQTVVVLGRYAKPGQGQFVLSGTRNGEAAQYVFDVSLPALATGESYVPRIWATRRVGALLEEVKLGNTDPKIVAEALALANRYGVVTEFTFFQLAENGDTAMTYSPVPVDAVGSVAVSTSSSLDSYQKGGTVDTPIDTWVRYYADRTLPSLGGWYTDTALSGSPAWVDLHFGSARYFDAVAAEPRLGGFFGVGASARFEDRGRAFRVTDPEAPAGGVLPVEAAYVPAPEADFEDEAATATYQPGAEPAPIANTPPDARVVMLNGETEAAGCSAGERSGSLAGLFVLMALAVLAVLRRFARA